jgi:hypothetical protein
LNILYPSGVDDTKILLCKDASYILLKVFYLHLIHVACLARVALVRETVKDVNIKRDIVYTRSNLAFLTTAITKPEAFGIPLHDSVDVVENVQ